MLRSLLVGLAMALGVGVFASNTTFQLRMNLRETPPPPPVVYQVQPPPVIYVMPGQGIYTPDGFVPYGYGNRIVPAPEYVEPPSYIPPMIRPAPRLPERIRRNRDGSYSREPDPHFHRYAYPRGPVFRTDGTAIYGLPGDGPEVYYFRYQRVR